MSKKLYEEANIQDIADAIREKNGEETTYKVSEMAQAILDIDGGTGDMPNLDDISFGNNPTVDNPGYTNPQYYEDIADAINYAIEHGGSIPEWNEPINRNWDFTNPLNRRGKSSYTGENSIDGWTCASLTTCVLDTGGIHIVKDESQAGTNMYYWVKINSSGMLDNKTVTLSMLANNKLATETVVIDPSKSTQTSIPSLVNIDGIAAWLIRDSATRLAIGFNNEGLGDSTLIQAVKLEVGDSQTLAELVNGEWKLIKHQNNDIEQFFLEDLSTNI